MAPTHGVQATLRTTATSSAKQAGATTSGGSAVQAGLKSPASVVDPARTAFSKGGCLEQWRHLARVGILPVPSWGNVGGTATSDPPRREKMACCDCNQVAKGDNLETTKIVKVRETSVTHCETKHIREQ